MVGNIKNRFHHCGQPAKLVQACVSVSIDRESSLLHCGGCVMLVQAWTPLLEQAGWPDYQPSVEEL